MTYFIRHSVLALLLGIAASAMTPSAADDAPLDLATLAKEPESFAGARIVGGKAELASDKWSFLLAKDEHADAELTATVTILETAKHLGYFGQSWSVWPDPTYGDGGFEAGVLLRAGKDEGYRVQLSHQLQ